jgi:hypothetical protein
MLLRLNTFQIISPASIYRIKENYRHLHFEISPLLAMCSWAELHCLSILNERGPDNKFNDSE